MDTSHTPIADDECSCGCTAYEQCDRPACPHHGPWPNPILDFGCEDDGPLNEPANLELSSD